LFGDFSTALTRVYGDNDSDEIHKIHHFFLSLILAKKIDHFE
jgi:hypothetical protein